MNAKALESQVLSNLVSRFVSNGGVIATAKRRRKMSKYLEYNHGITAKGRMRGQFGPAREYKLGW